MKELRYISYSLKDKSAELSFYDSETEETFKEVWNNVESIEVVDSYLIGVQWNYQSLLVLDKLTKDSFGLFTFRGPEGPVLQATRDEWTIFVKPYDQD